MAIPNINLKHFLALTNIADSGRLSAAAEQVFMSQSALTQALRKLENSAGTPLFERVGFGVTETPAGDLLVRRARRAGDLLATAERELRSRIPDVGSSSPLHHHFTASHLRALIAVVATGGYSFAARRLGLAQPTVHRAAKDLEHIVGTSLFPRAARGVEPTNAARILARYAELVFVEIRQGFEEVAELQGNTSSRVAIGCLPLARSDFLPTALTQLLSKFPDANVSILDGPYIEQLHALRYGRIDWLIGALRDPAPTGDVIQEALFEEPLAIVVRPGHPLIEEAPPSFSDLARLDWIAPQRLAPTRRFFDDFFERGGKRAPTRVIECSSLVATRGLLRRSDRAAMLSPMQVREDVRAGELAVLVESIPGSSRSIGITIRGNWEPTMVQREVASIVYELAKDVNQAAFSNTRTPAPVFEIGT